MSNSGPSASEVAAEVRKSHLLNRLRIENPSLYIKHQSLYQRQRIIVGSFAVILILIGIIISIVSENFLPLITFTVIASVINFVVEKGSAANEILNEFETDLINREINSQDQIKDIKSMSEENFRSRGVKVIAHPNSTVFVNSKVVNSFNNIEKSSPDLANAVATLIGFVEDKNNPKAVEVLEDLISEINGEKKSSKIQASWEYLVKILPDIAKLSSAAATISKLF